MGVGTSMRMHVGARVLLSPHSNLCAQCLCVRVHRDWCFEAFVDVKILRAGDDLLSSAVGKPRYVGHVEPRALYSPRSFFFSVRVLQPSRFGFTGANENIPKLPVRRQQQPPTSNEHSRI